MKSLVEFITEAKTPEFKNNLDSIKEFCKYVFSPAVSDWTVNPDKTITVVPRNERSNLVYMNCEDLKEIPSFIKFSGMENVGLSIVGDNLVNAKINTVGPIANLFLLQCKKVISADFGGVELTGSFEVEGNTKLQTLVGPKTTGPIFKILIKKNKSLETINLSKMDDYAKYIYVDHNAKLDLKKSKLPKHRESVRFLEIDKNEIH